MNQAAKTKPPVRATWVCLCLAWVFFLIPVPGLGVGVGGPLNLAALILAIVVMAKGSTMEGLIPMLLALIVSPLVWFLGIGIFSMFFVGGMAALNEI